MPRKIGLIFFINMALFSYTFLNTAIAQNVHFRWQIGETLTYSAKWMHLRVATIKMNVCDTVRSNDQRLYQIKFTVDSNPHLFFLNIHANFESLVDEHFRPHLYISDEKQDGITYQTTYRFNYKDSLINVKMTDEADTSRVIVKTVKMDDRIFDGMSLLFYLRNHVQSIQDDTIFVFVNGEKKKVHVKLKKKTKHIYVDALERKVNSFELRGHAHFRSFAGITGDFKAYIAEQQQLPLVKASLNVFLGSVIINLESWERDEEAVSEYTLKYQDSSK